MHNDDSGNNNDNNGRHLKQTKLTKVALYPSKSTNLPSLAHFDIHV